MTEFIKETLGEIKSVGKKVSWIGSYDGEFAMSLEEFKKLPEVNYDSGFGGQEIPSNIIIVFEDGSFCDRDEYDGSESWSYNECPIKKPDTKKFTLKRELGNSTYKFEVQ